MPPLRAMLLIVSKADISWNIRAKKVKQVKYIASCSFGKDSIATALLAIQHHEPLDELIYCEVMFDDKISGEVPEHIDFIHNIAIPFFGKAGIHTTVLRGKMTYLSSFNRIIGNGKAKGKLNSFPLCGKCCIQRDCKLPPIKAYMKELPNDTVQYIGIANDEQARLLRLKGNQVSLLDKYSVTENRAREMCEKAGLLSPLYSFSDRGGCWFCPNAKDRELRHLRDYHPDLWKRMLQLQTVPNKATERFNRSSTFAEIDERFYWEDQQTDLFSYARDNNLPA